MSKLSDNLPQASNWRTMAPTLLLMAAVLVLFRDTAVAMVTIWLRSDTFAHAFLVPPITVWLIWRRREQLALLPIRARAIVLLPMFAFGFLWLLGELASVNALTQVALVALLVLAVPATVGWPVTRALSFPLLFLFFAAPVGEFLVPYMMDWTADFATAAVRMSGVPVYREGLQFVIPSGSWSVVEACSGVRYLIASFMVGTLFAYLNFQTPWRRGVFILVSLLMPILANWVRAYLIVMIGHLSDNRLAAGVDHIIYGWAFFGLVIGGMFFVGARFAESDVSLTTARDAGGNNPPDAAVQAGRNGGRWAVAACAAALLLGVHGLLWTLDRATEGQVPVLNLPAGDVPGWHEADAPVSAWVPAYAQAVAQLSHSYQGDGAKAGLWVSYYRHQGYHRKLVTSTNTLVGMEGQDGWAQTGSDARSVVIGSDGPMTMLAAELRGSAEVGQSDAQRLLVWQVYWIGGVYTSSAARARAHLALNRLLGRGDDGAALFFYTPISSRTGRDAADAVLGRFVPAAWPAVARLLSQAQQDR